MLKRIKKGRKNIDYSWAYILYPRIFRFRFTDRIFCQIVGMNFIEDLMNEKTLAGDFHMIS
jgi:hypothetical protein